MARKWELETETNIDNAMEEMLVEVFGCIPLVNRVIKVRKAVQRMKRDVSLARNAMEETLVEVFGCIPLDDWTTMSDVASEPVKLAKDDFPGAVAMEEELIEAFGGAHVNSRVIKFDDRKKLRKDAGLSGAALVETLIEIYGCIPAGSRVIKLDDRKRARAAQVQPTRRDTSGLAVGHS
jgi:hypothetical protein